MSQSQPWDNPAYSSSQLSGVNWMELLTKLGPSALQLIGGVGQGIAQGNMSADQIAEQRRQFDISQQLAQKQLANSQGTSAFTATQMNPLAQQNSRTKNALAAALMGGASTGGRNLAFTPGVKAAIAPYTDRGATAAADAAFQQTAQNASPGYVSPDLSKVGYGATGAGLVTPGANGNSGMPQGYVPPVQSNYMNTAGGDFGSGSEGDTTLMTEGGTGDPFLRGDAHTDLNLTLDEVKKLLAKLGKGAAVGGASMIGGPLAGLGVGALMRNQ